jgi:hypothetical protein
MPPIKEHFHHMAMSCLLSTFLYMSRTRPFFLIFSKCRHYARYQRYDNLFIIHVDTEADTVGLQDDTHLAGYNVWLVPSIQERSLLLTLIATSGFLMISNFYGNDGNPLTWKVLPSCKYIDCSGTDLNA